MCHECIIIAEAGVNHNGNLKTAKKMAVKAREAGADYIKFQTFIPKALVAEYADKAAYQKDTTGADKTQQQMLEELALTFDEFRELKEYCDALGIGFISTPFDMESIDFLATLDMNFWKIPSGEITNYPYLVRIAETNMPVILSTGMCELSEIDSAVNILMEHGADKVSLLHCNTQYPTPYRDVNLNAMNTLRERYGVSVGYSDHTEGIEVSIAAVALGATVIEKHFTLDRNMKGPDHRASIEPHQLKAMVNAIRNIEKAIGSAVKKPTASESENRDVARKSIVANRPIQKGELLSEINLTTKRPGNGLSPMLWNSVIGTRAIRNFAEDELIEV